ALDPIFLVALVPVPDRVVVHKQHPGDRLAAHAVVQQNQRVGAARQPMHGGPVASQLDQVLSRFGVQEATADHGGTRIASSAVGKRILRISAESGYNERYYSVDW